MPKSKQFLGESKKKSKHAQQAPATADEYLAVGVDFEEAGEKWRGGDAAKSTRFFLRAINCYDEALMKFPGSFDLAYNKARCQYELTQHPKLKDQLPGSLLDLLQTALDSSRYALGLKEDNADVLFNTAQVLTSLAQALEDQRNNTIDPLPLLEEAIERFQQCLSLQEYHYTENLAQEQAMQDELSSQASVLPDSEDGGASLSSPRSESQEEEHWATIIEPVTNSVLLDTLLAQLETLAYLTSQIPPENSKLLSWIEEYSTQLLNVKLPTYVEGTNREAEAGLTRANFIAALADANFRAQRIDPPTYAHTLDEAFSPLNLTTDPEGLVNRAEALHSYNSSLRSFPELSTNENLASRWKALSTALDCLTTASKLPAAEELAKIHLVRGDVELLRSGLGKEGYEVAVKNQEILIKNAEKFYRGAASVARSTGAMKEFEEAEVKEAVALGLKSEADKIMGAWKSSTDRERVRGVLEDMVEDGLVDGGELIGMGIA